MSPTHHKVHGGLHSLRHALPDLRGRSGFAQPLGEFSYLRHAAALVKIHSVWPGGGPSMPRYRLLCDSQMWLVCEASSCASWGGADSTADDEGNDDGEEPREDWWSQDISFLVTSVSSLLLGPECLMGQEHFLMHFRFPAVANTSQTNPCRSKKKQWYEVKNILN